jgi:hypothetical protein
MSASDIAMGGISGAASGFSMGGPIGAAVGGGIGILTSFIGGAEKQREAERLRHEQQQQAVSTASDLYYQKLADGGTVGNNTNGEKRTSGINTAIATGDQKQRFDENSDPNFEKYKKLKALSEKMRDLQGQHTAELVKLYPQLLPLLQKTNDDPNFKNTDIDAYTKNLVKELGIDPSVPASDEYVRTAREYGNYAAENGFQFNLVGDKEENGKLAKFGLRNMLQKNLHSSDVPAYKILEPKKPEQKLAEGGEVTGPGTTTSDSIKTTLDEGDIVVPAKHARLAKEIGEKYLGWKPNEVVNTGGNRNVALSKKEIVFKQAEVQRLAKFGIDVNNLID